MDINDLKNKLSRLAQQSPDFVNRIAPHAVATVAANHFKENFQTESFEGNKWPEVNRRKASYVSKTTGKTHKNYTKGAATLRPILTGQTGDLGRSIEPDANKSTSGTAVVTSKFYGQYHNEGQGHLPKRQYMGQTPKLNQIISDELTKQFYKFFSQP